MIYFNSRTVLSSGQIVNETTSRSGILSEHEQVSSYSHSKNNLSEFCYKLCKYDNFSPEEKQMAIIQKANSLLGQNLMSILKSMSVFGHVFSYTPSTKESSFVLQER